MTFLDLRRLKPKWVTNGTTDALDPVDAGIGIATTTFTPDIGGNFCDGVPIDIQGFNWQFPGWASIMNMTPSPDGVTASATSLSFSDAGVFARVAYLTNSSDCDAFIGISAHFTWRWDSPWNGGSQPAFYWSTDPNSFNYYQPAWCHWIDGIDSGTEDPQFWIPILRHSVTPVYFVFTANGGFSGSLSITY